MTEAVITKDAEAPAPPASEGRTIYRHALLVRVCHWINALTLGVLFLSGLNIFNAHPALYWGKKAAFDAPLLSLHAAQHADGSWGGLTQIGSLHLWTTGFLGLSKGQDGQLLDVGFPGWMTLPNYRDLADARHWHFFFAWLLVVNGVAYVTWSLRTRHIQRDLWTPLRQFKTIPAELWHHLRLQFPEGEAARDYNVLQKLSYFGVIFILLPLMILTGLSMSPGVDSSFFHVLPSVFGGRQSARTIHFICCWLLAGFFAVHIVMVLISGVWNNLRSMITGRYVLPEARSEHAAGPDMETGA